MQKNSLLSIVLNIVILIIIRQSKRCTLNPLLVLPSIQHHHNRNSNLQNISNVTLDTLTEGFLGELKLRKSGKVQLWINNVLFDVDIGTQVGFLQELYSVDGVQDRQNSTDKGNMTNLGRVRNRVVVTPAWNDLLLAANGEETSSDSDDD